MGSIQAQCPTLLSISQLGQFKKLIRMRFGHLFISFYHIHLIYVIYQFNVFFLNALADACRPGL